MQFVKMHGCGNDFIVIREQENMQYETLAIRLCNRSTGIGADGLLVVKENPLEMLIYNADGSQAPMCGNGIRCFALYCYRYGIELKREYDVVTLAGIMRVLVVQTDPFQVRIDMGKASFNQNLLQFTQPIKDFKHEVQIEKEKILLHSVFIGTIHTIVFVDSFTDDVLTYAKNISEHALFREKTNVNFVIIKSPSELYVKTYERGCGWTLACGTGCCAAVYIAHKLGLVGTRVMALLEYGSLKIDLQERIYMEGPAKIEFESEVKIC